jgi:uncharacterized protein (TIGR03086 family)
VPSTVSQIFKSPAPNAAIVAAMTDAPTELPVFPTTAPEVFRDAEATVSLFDAVLGRLADVVDVADDQLGRPTPCASFTVAELRRHVLAWLQFFAAALSDPSADAPRLDPESWDLGADGSASAIVRAAAADIAAAARSGVAAQLVVMSQSRMAGDGVLAMALGEYLVHGWDLAVATGREDVDTMAFGDEAAAALAFLRTMVVPEYRGPDTGFFDEEVPASADATAFEQLLCFAGRDPAWTAPR